jgi:hypothetical protein
LLAASLLLLTGIGGCAESETAGGGIHPEDDTGLDVSDAVSDVSDVTPQARLTLCVLNDQGPSGACADPGVLDFASVAADESVERLFRVDNEGDVPAEFASVQIGAPEFETTVVVYSQDPNAPNAFERTEEQLPLIRQPGEAIYVEVTYTAGPSAGALPADEVEVNYNVGTSETIIVPMSGQATGCPEGLGDCDGDPANGCETDLDASMDHCGGCGQLCEPQNAAEATCSEGSCEVTTCEENYEDCDGDGATGCEVDTSTSLDHCGGCGAICDRANGDEVCNAGVCEVTTCSQDYDDCNGLDFDGCETDLLSNVDHCTACNQACILDHATAACTEGACAIDSCDPGFEDCDGDPANGCETNIQTDAGNCGACSNSCSVSGATGVCINSSCTIGSCDGGYEDCDQDGTNGCEIDLQTDTTNCGACGTECTNDHGSTMCSAGACEPTCSGLWDDCDGDLDNGCETTLADLDNCGACGVTCDLANASETCSTGTCELGACEPGFEDCDGDPSNGCEVDLNNDLGNCGSCATVCANDHGPTTCNAGTCEPTCTGLWDDCDSDLTNGCETSLGTLNDCGTCGIACEVTNASETCSTGVCELDTCESGHSNCDGNDTNGCEVDTTSDVANCGACANQCTNPNGSTSCDQSACSPSCNLGYGSCDGDADDGCETPLNTLSNCGGCGVTCDLPNASETCGSMACQLLSCESGYADCDGDPSNGCEVNVEDDAGNCGSCGNVCANENGTTTCSSGTCAPSCSGSYASCNGDPDDGCETPINTTSDCGACGNSCSLANATEACSSQSCIVASCDPGFASCDGSDLNGCEIDLTSDAGNCGSCGNQCTNAHGSNSCSGGSCAPTCDSGYDDCNADPADGCESSLDTTTNCGVCGNTCNLPNATAMCSAGGCAIAACDAGYSDCDGDPSNGCEVNLLSSSSNCGACGNQCTNAHGSTSCSGGSCAPSCSSGWDSCDGDADDGCETSLTTTSNCGSCGSTCSLANGTESCSTGSCQVTDCYNKWCDSNGYDYDGCEYNLDTNPTCGSASYAGSVSGDTGGGGDTITINGRGERWYRVRVREDSNNIEGPQAKITLNSPTGTDYDLRAYCSGCSGSYAGSFSSGSVDTVGFSWGDSWGGDDTTDIYFKVETFSADVCANWTVTIAGDTTTANPSGC